MILSLVELVVVVVVPFEVWCGALLVSANRAETLRLRKLLLWWNMLRESNFEDGKTFIKGFLELSDDKLTEFEVIVDDDEGWDDWVTIIFGTAVAFSIEVVVVGVGGVLDTSGDGDLVRQFLNHKSGVIRFSTKRPEIETN